MRTLESALSEHELITLRVIGEWWELDLRGADKTASVKALAETLAGLDFSLEMSYLPPEEADALRTLIAAGGRQAVGTFTRQHGEVRQMGPGRLEREEPWYDPISPAEALWYRGFLYRAFHESEDGGALVEYYFLPSELLSQMEGGDGEAAAQNLHDGAQAPNGALSAAGAPLSFAPAATDAVDDLTTVLAFAQQSGLVVDAPAPLRPFLLDEQPDRLSLLITLAVELGFLREGADGLRPARAAVGWLKQGREGQLRALVDAWSSSGWNDLCHTPGLRCEGSGWENDPIAARSTLLDALPRDGAWYSLDDLVATIKEVNPDFQRPEGNYDTWYIRDEESNAYLKGFESWEQVEGRLLRFLIHGPLFWLGMIEVGEGRYHLTERALAWLSGDPVPARGVEVPPVVRPEATVLVPYNANRYQRFQVARVAEADPVLPGQPYHYRLTPHSLSEARESGIAPERVLAFLREASGRPIPASVRRAVERWSERGLEGVLQPAVILRVREADILDKLQANARTRPFIGERLGDLAAVIPHDNWHELQQVAAQLGLLLEIEA
ncbi:MAG: helicase-associated domain-containing protein [Candidatus Promineifilaceae bacterium]|nr:helicase-associated domain-containing protein [Candidatus Promineifilaceae bacterium]